MKKSFTILSILLLVISLIANSCREDDNPITKNETFANNLNQLVLKTVQIGDDISMLIPLKLPKAFLQEFDNCKTENEINNVLKKYGVKDSNKVIFLLKQQQSLAKNFYNDNSNFYKQHSTQDIQKVISIELDTYFKSVENTGLTSKSCYDQYRTDMSRADRNYVGCMAGAWATAVFTEGVGGLIVGGGCVIMKLWQESDAIEDYQSCTN